MKFKRVAIHYPTAVVEDDQLEILGQRRKIITDDRVVIGAGELVNDDDRKAYGFPESDTVEVEVPIQADEYGLGATLNFDTPTDITALWRGCVSSWRRVVQGA